MRKFKFDVYVTNVTGTLQLKLSTYVVIYRRILLMMRNVTDASCRKKSKHILCSITFSENRAFDEVM
jgi:hypothetical protein